MRNSTLSHAGIEPTIDPDPTILGDHMSNTSGTEIDEAVARYRESISREADIGRATLDEIEDHLRLLVDDLRAKGMPAAVAVTEAAQRLGDPRQLAREHSRVRTPFGSKLPMWRALAVIALVIPQLVENVRGSDMMLSSVELAIGLAMCGALVWRSSWSRAVMLGTMAWNAAWSLCMLAFTEVAPPVWMIALSLGALALLLPARRRELTASGWALAMIYPIYVSVAVMSYSQVTVGPGDYVLVPWIAPAVAILAGAGLVLRARWASIAAIGATVYLAFFFHLLATLDYHVDHPVALQTILLSYTGVGLLMTLAVAVIGWKTARSNLGLLRGVLQ
jgi:hypothetical protein